MAQPAQIERCNKGMADSLCYGQRSPRRHWSASCSPYCSLGTRWKESRTGCPAFLSKFIVIGVIMNDKVWIRSLALGFLFVLSSVVTSYMVFILKKYFNAMNHPWAVYGMLLFMQIIIGLVGEKINQGMRVGKMNIIQRICVLVPALLLFISSVMFRQNGIRGNGFLAWYSELLDGGVVLGCVLVSDLCFYIVNAINGRTC